MFQFFQYRGFVGPNASENEKKTSVLGPGHHQTNTEGGFRIGIRTPALNTSV